MQRKMWRAINSVKPTLDIPPSLASRDAQDADGGIDSFSDFISDLPSCAFRALRQTTARGELVVDSDDGDGFLVSEELHKARPAAAARSTRARRRRRPRRRIGRARSRRGRTRWRRRS